MYCKKIFMLFFALLMFGGCNKQEVVFDESEINTVGNIGGGNFSCGHMASQGEWIFYSDCDEKNSGLYRMRKNSDVSERILNGKISSVNIVGNDVYYVKTYYPLFSDISKSDLYKANTAGGENKKLIDNVGYAMVINDKIYYKIDMDDIGYKKAGNYNYPNKEIDGRLFCSDLDGNNAQMVVDKIVDAQIIVGDYLYCGDIDSGGDTDGDVYRINLNTGEKEIISKNADLSAVDNDYIYFNGFNKLIRMDLQSRKKKRIIKKQASFELITVIAYNDKIYYNDSNNNVYVINNNGSSDKMLSDKAEELYLLNDGVYAWNVGKIPVKIHMD